MKKQCEHSGVEIETPRTVRVYMCGIDWQHEIGFAPRGMHLFASIADLRKHKSCADECGIVELEIREVKWVQEQKL